jgi:AcrR family transcriptional regulator
LSVADIARAAGCSVGSFYVRFVDKDQYFLAYRRELSGATPQQSGVLYEGHAGDSWWNAPWRASSASSWITQSVAAALKKSVAEPEFWEDFREMGRQSVNAFSNAMRSCSGARSAKPRPSRSASPSRWLRGTLNNTLLNTARTAAARGSVFRRQIERAFQPGVRVD